jgi:hypothetical protein
MISSSSIISEECIVLMIFISKLFETFDLFFLCNIAKLRRVNVHFLFNPVKDGTTGIDVQSLFSPLLMLNVLCLHIR